MNGISEELIIILILFWIIILMKILMIMKLVSYIEYLILIIALNTFIENDFLPLRDYVINNRNIILILIQYSSLLRRDVDNLRRDVDNLRQDVNNLKGNVDSLRAEVRKIKENQSIMMRLMMQMNDNIKEMKNKLK